MARVFMSVLTCLVGVFASIDTAKPKAKEAAGDQKMRLGNFSVSLAVKDLAASRAFYEKLDFRRAGGDGKTYSILQNETSTIGVFQGMLDQNILTYNPGWDRNTKTLPDFDDVRSIKKTLKSRGLTLLTSADESSTGPASLTLKDPDGNLILFDQHVPSPKKKKAASRTGAAGLRRSEPSLGHDEPPLPAKGEEKDSQRSPVVVAQRAEHRGGGR